MLYRLFVGTRRRWTNSRIAMTLGSLMVMRAEWISTSYSFTTVTASFRTAVTLSCQLASDSGRYSSGFQSQLSTSAGYDDKGNAVTMTRSYSIHLQFFPRLIMLIA